MSLRKKPAQNVAQTIFLSELTDNFFRFFLKKYPRKFGLLMIFQKAAQSKQMPNWRKIAQSCHPASYQKLRAPDESGTNFFKKLPPHTLTGFDLTIHSSSLLGGRRRR
jgi:hypothetical protein